MVDFVANLVFQLLQTALHLPELNVVARGVSLGDAIAEWNVELVAVFVEVTFFAGGYRSLRHSRGDLDGRVAGNVGERLGSAD